jgi:LPS sulfotransferase NodH
MPDTGALASVAPKNLERHAVLRDFLARDLFFVGAFPKSGSTWLQVMLNAHPEVGCRGEGHFFNNLWPLLEEALNRHNTVIDRKNATIFAEFQPYPRFDRDHFEYLMAVAVGLLMTRAHGDQDKRVLGEKTPNTVLRLTQLEAVFPRAKFVHVVRDGRDCAVSAWFHNHRTNPEELYRRHGTFERFSEHIAKIWLANVTAGLKFRSGRAEQCHVVRYEDLSRDPLVAMRPLLAFLGVDTDDAIVRRCVAEGRFEKMSGGRARGEEDRSSFLRRGVVGDWREHFGDEANQRFFAIAGPLMEKVGYRL